MWTVLSEVVRVRGPYCFCVTLVPGRCAVHRSRRTAQLCLHWSPHTTPSFMEQSCWGGPTLSTLDTITEYILYLFPLLPWRMKELLQNLSSKPPALHLQGPLAPCCRVCMARAVPTRSTGHHCPSQHTTQLFALNGSAFAYIWCKYR